jgi:uncharacterized protein (DUF2164 family)
MAGTARVSKERKAAMVKLVRQYLEDEFEVETGDLSAELLLDYVGGLIGPAWYNEGLMDARAVVSKRSDDVQEELVGMERPLGEPPRGR